MDWTEIYKDAVSAKDILLVRTDPPEGVIDLKDFMPPGECPAAKWHTDNCPPFKDAVLEVEYHDDRCESFFVHEANAWTECACEPRARERRDRDEVDG